MMPRRRSTPSSPAFTVMVDDIPVEVFPGDSAAIGILLARGHAMSSTGGQPVSRVYCGIGLCMQCLVTIDGESGVQACQARLKPGMQIGTGS